jgi:hypothetical protein
MKRTAVLILATVFMLSACIPVPFLGQPTVAPAIDEQATDAAMAATFAAETLNALPTPTLIPATEPLEPTATNTELPSVAATATETATPDPNATSTETMVPQTATTTGTLATATQVVATATETLYPRFFGTLPPALPFGQVKLSNRAKVDVYVSLQCTTIDGYKTIIEYPVFGSFSVSAPAGRYNYVAWVGGRQFQGSFRLSKGEDLSITFNKDKVTIK